MNAPAGLSSIIAVIDDDLAIQRALRVVFEARGITVKVFSSAEEFLNSCYEGMANCLLIDYLMPKMDGLLLLKEIRKRNIQLPAILMTGDAYHDIFQDVINAGGSDLLEKPFRIKRLLELVDKYFPNL